jgi:hypothetical protein
MRSTVHSSVLPVEGRRGSLQTIMRSLFPRDQFPVLMLRDLVSSFPYHAQGAERPNPKISLYFSLLPGN